MSKVLVETGLYFFAGSKGRTLISQRGYEVKRTTVGMAWVWVHLSCGAGPNHALTATVAQRLGFSWKKALIFGASASIVFSFLLLFPGSLTVVSKYLPSDYSENLRFCVFPGM